MKPICHFLFLLSLLTYCLFLQPLAAQTTQASIQGTITDERKQPVPGASVMIRNESTGFTSRTVSNAKGDYVFKELPLGGPYSIVARYLGYEELKKNGYNLNQGDVIGVSFTLGSSVKQIAGITVTGNANAKGKVENLGAATSVSPKLMNKMPVNGRNFANLMDLSPLSRGGNISGQLGSSTNFSIDGMTAKNPTSAGATTSRSGAPYSISIEAVREFKVVTNQYDVTYGRSGGGTVSAVTKSGTNTLTGFVFGFGRANWLTSKYDIKGNKRANDYSTYQFGFSLGGPLIKDKLHFFVTWDRQVDKRSLVIADIQTAADEDFFKITRAKLDSVVQIGREKYGISPTQRQYGSFDKKRTSDAVFLRLDWQINKNNLLTIRNNLTNDNNKLGLVDNTPINLYESTGNDFNFDNSFLVTLRSSVNSKLTNELKVQHLYTYQSSEPGNQLPASNIPRAIVENISSVTATGNRSTNVEFGGHRFAQEFFRNNVFQLVNNLYYNTNSIRYTFGVDFMYTHARSLYGSEVNGRFHYNTISGLMANKPYNFYREVPLMDDPSVVSNIFNIGFYGQLQTKIATGMEITAGLRGDYAHYPTSPFNQLVFDELGVRTDHKLRSFIIQPRFQLTWDVQENHRDYIRIGAGVFASDINNYVVINNLTFDGKHFGTVDVRGADVPAADFIGFRDNPASKPTLAQFQLPTINTNGPDAKVPVVYKANISYTRFITERLRAGITGYLTLARNNYFYVDRNMAQTPFFTLKDEDNRGVFVPLNTMTKDGIPNWKDGRISKNLGRVLELNSDGKVNQMAVVVDVSYNYYKDGELSFSYTWNDTKDNTSFNGNVANSATLSLPVKDDPRNLSNITYSDNQFRHKVVFYAVSPTWKGFNLGIRYSGIGGTRYSLLSGVNSNGDFVNGTNDLAYIFDPNSSAVPKNVRDGLQAVLDNPKASPSIKDYIRRYAGRMAERNGGINGFYGTFDLRASKKFSFGKTKKQGFEVSADLFNVANVFNKKWGTYKNLGNQGLYKREGFDVVNQRFNYGVNTDGSVEPTGNPFQFQIGCRYSF
ncbi:Carboxypeptidase regulatory-like domain-containing protein [Chitinophaga eiseniae]|uniref:Carboxypeptidase regulatory-like domain-containing protein n=1 Tax=Chitinophaga eiseniae TaxID=634771 RepID=A0A1T4TSV0_9BACT|nr:carboxypeptidase regulatory-like domain-containing protein [Chitinophaga eiseniae]SKA43421.1 Carboxypeptidase regulatory-like domain-containing protein [Chitinophaga eiseniae]